MGVRFTRSILRLEVFLGHPVHGPRYRLFWLSLKPLGWGYVAFAVRAGNADPRSIRSFEWAL